MLVWKNCKLWKNNSKKKMKCLMCEGIRINLMIPRIIMGIMCLRLSSLKRKGASMKMMKISISFKCLESTSHTLSCLAI